MVSLQSRRRAIRERSGVPQSPAIPGSFRSSLVTSGVVRWAPPIWGAPSGGEVLSAPGDDIISVGTDGKPSLSGGTSVATPFVTGAIALLWSLFPAETAIRVKSAVLEPGALRRATIVPPFLDAWGAYHLLAKGLTWRRRKVSDQAEVLGRPGEPIADPMIGGMFEQTPLPRRDTGMILRPQAGGGSCGCSCGGLVGSNPEEAGAPIYPNIFALGRIEPRFPSLGVEKEFAQATGERRRPS